MSVRRGCIDSGDRVRACACHVNVLVRFNFYHLYARVSVHACIFVTGRSTIAGIGSDDGKMGVQTDSPDEFRKAAVPLVLG